MASPAPAPRASLSSLPPELKAEVVRLVAGGDSLDDLHTRQYAQRRGGDDDSNDLIRIPSWSDSPSILSSLRSVSLVNREFAQLAFPHLWKRVNLAPRAPHLVEWILTFCETVLPRHAHHIRAIKFKQNATFARDPIPTERVVALLSSDLRAEFDAFDMGNSWRQRSYLLATIIDALPRLGAIAFDLAPGKERERRLDPNPVVAVAPEVERVMNPVLRAIEAIGDQLTDLIISDSWGTCLDGPQLAGFLRSCPHLRRLSINIELRPDNNDHRAMANALASLTKLESLQLSESYTVPPDSYWVGASLAQANWVAPLRVLKLGSCDGLKLAHLRTLVEKFGPTLQTLHLSGAPYEVTASSSADEPLRRWHLPTLRHLVLECNLDDAFLDSLANAPLRTFRLGRCPQMSVQKIEESINHVASRMGPERLQEVRIGVFTRRDWLKPRKEQTQAMCRARGVECIIEVDQRVRPDLVRLV